ESTTFAVQFGTTNQPPTVSGNQTASSYTPAALVSLTTYYWQVVARNGTATTAGPIWSFQTRARPTHYDFNGDGRPDLLWRNYSTGATMLWFQNSVTTVGTATVQSAPDVNWKIVGAGDVNGDGREDIVWHHALTGANVVWYMNRGVLMSSGTLPGADVHWQPVALDDFDGDGRPDILWRHSVSGSMTIWFMDGTTIASAAAVSGAALTWEVVGAGDLNGD